MVKIDYKVKANAFNSCNINMGQNMICRRGWGISDIYQHEVNYVCFSYWYLGHDQSGMNRVPTYVRLPSRKVKKLFGCIFCICTLKLVSYQNKV